MRLVCSVLAGAFYWGNWRPLWTIASELSRFGCNLKIKFRILFLKAACVLHNFLCVHETGNNIPATLADVGDQPNGAWRQQISQHLPQAPLRTSCDQLQTTSRLRVEEEAEAMEVRHKLMHFYATVGAVEWQGWSTDCLILNIIGFKWSNYVMS